MSRAIYKTGDVVIIKDFDSSNGDRKRFKEWIVNLFLEEK